LLFCLQILAARHVLVTIATFALLAREKAAGRDGPWRTRESTRHALSRFGGWPGVWLVQRMLRHRTGKGAFKLVFRLPVAVSVSALVSMTVLYLA